MGSCHSAILEVPGSRPWQGLGSGTAEIKKAAGVLVFEAGARAGPPDQQAIRLTSPGLEFRV